MDHRLTESEVKQVLVACYADPVRFCKFFLAHLFPGPIPWVHRGLLAILTGRTQFLLHYGELRKIIENFTWKDENQEEHSIFTVTRDGEELHGEDLNSLTGDEIITMKLGRFTLIMMPRGFSKTTIAGMAVPLYDILYENCPFTLYLSAAGEHSKMQLDNIKRELSGNDRIAEFFGDLKPRLTDDERWSQTLFETSTGMTMAARGSGAQVRGMNHAGNRPHKIICDDLEDREKTETEHQREKMRTWAYGDLIPALSELDNDFGIESEVRVLGTLLHREALLMTFAKDPDWTVVHFGVFDKDGEPIWPSLMDREKYEKKKRSFTMANMLHVFYMEYENAWRAPEKQKFRPEFIQHGVPDRGQVVGRAIYMDPAISEEPGADRTSICVGSMLSSGGLVLEEHWTKRGALPREQIDTFFSLAMKWRPNYHGCESNGYQKALIHLIREEMFRHGYYFEMIAVHHSKAKDLRVLGILAPRYAAGYIWHARVFPDMETELLDWGARGSLMDGPDSWAACVSLLDPYAGEAAVEDISKDEYEPLDFELGQEAGRWCH